MKSSKPWKIWAVVLPIIGSFLFAGAALAQTTRYVMPVNPGAAAPYTSWATAATNIQDAVDACAPGDTVRVTNGFYASGGAAAPGSILSNRVCVTRPITVASVNGPEATVISGVRTNGLSAMRGVYLTNGASLHGFTVTNGATRTSGDYYLDRSGGGIWCEAGADVLVSNCLAVGNTADAFGGGLYQGTVKNCVLEGNNANYGGGSYGSLLSKCTLSDNSAYSGGGIAPPRR